MSNDFAKLPYRLKGAGRIYKLAAGPVHHTDPANNGLSVHFNQDPNVDHNGALTGIELKELPSLMVSQSSLTDALDNKVEELQTSPRVFSNKLLQQQRDLETTQSQLLQTTELKSVRLQRATVSKGMDKLAALMRPIRRLPVEILKFIFEFTVWTSGSNIWQAMELSWVCQLWRAVSLDTPRLWDSITVTPFKNSDKAWEIWISRAKAVPTTAKIAVITEEHLPLMRTWNLMKMPNLQTLRLEAVFSVYIPSIYERLFPLPYLPLRQLSMITRQVASATWPGEANSIAKFPALVNLELSGVIPPYLGPLGSCSLKILSLQHMEHVDLCWITWHLPQLETVFMSSVSFATPAGPAAVTSKIQYLKIFDSTLFEEPWASNLRFPRLESFEYGDPSTDILLEYLTAHPHLQKLDFIPEYGHMAQCAVAVPRLSHLGISIDSAEIIGLTGSGAMGVPFARLKVLTYRKWSEPLSAEGFEAIVRTRCLPMTHPKSLLEYPTQPLEAFRILVNDNTRQRAPWAFHELAQEAIQEVIPDEDDGFYYYVSMCWKQ